MERKCCVCKETLQIDEKNSCKAILYDRKYYDYECFLTLCEKRMQRNATKEKWTKIYNNIDKLVENTTKYVKDLVIKDNIYQWMRDQYDVSIIDAQTFTKLDNIYDGTFRGQCYPISPQELLDQWKYCIKYLRDARSSKQISGCMAIRYDLSVLLAWNADYRKEIKKKESIVADMTQLTKREEINYNNLSQQNQSHKEDDDFSDMFDEIFGE